MVFKEISNLLQKIGYTVYAPDLPGFGKQPLLFPKMNLNDYVDFVADFIKRNKINKVILLGHSFGGRVSIKFVNKFPNLVSAIILTGAPGIKQKLSFPKKTARNMAMIFTELFRFKALLPIKKILRKGLYFVIGEWDYYNAGDLRETFKNVIGEDLSPLLSKIKIPTLLVWGENDIVVPLSVGKAMRDKIKNSELAVIKNTGHKLPYEAPKDFFQTIKTFLSKQ